MRKKIRERFMNKKVFNRIYLEGKDFQGTTLKIGDKLKYDIDPTTKVVKIFLNEDYQRQVTVSYRKPKISQRKENDTRLFPVVDIGNKDVIKNFGNCTCAKLVIYEDGFELIPWTNVQADKSQEVISETTSTEVPKRKGFMAFMSEKKELAIKCTEDVATLVFKLPKDTPVSKSKRRKVKEALTQQLSLFDVGYTLSEDEQTQALAQTDDFKKEEPILARTLKVFSLFSGVGAFEMALRNLGIKFKLLNYSENDKYASQSYAAIHQVSEELNLGDITKIDMDKLPTDVDLITHGSPCQDFSTAGKGLGGDEGSQTRSSLMWNAVECIRRCLPRFVIWENVKGVLSKKNKHNYEKYLHELEKIGYTNQTFILNAKDYGLPQNRERVFVISTQDATPIEAPLPFESSTCIEDILEAGVGSTREVCKPFRLLEDVDLTQSTREIHKVAYTPYAKNPDKIHQSNTVYHPKGISPATCRDHEKQPLMVLTEKDNSMYQVRRLSALEHWRLMGFSDEDYDKASQCCSKTQLYRQAGNSIALNVIECVMYQLFKATEFCVTTLTPSVLRMLNV